MCRAIKLPFYYLCYFTTSVAKTFVVVIGKMMDSGVTQKDRFYRSLVLHFWYGAYNKWGSCLLILHGFPPVAKIASSQRAPFDKTK